MMSARPAVLIGDRVLGPGHSAYIVAELSGNHNGDLDRAIRTIQAAAEAGADAVKLQTYTADTLTIDAEGPDFRVSGAGPWSGRTLYDLYQEAHTPWEWHAALFEAGRSAGVEVFSTPFDDTAVELLEGLGAPAYKIASFELPDDALLRRVAATGKPVILSTGMAGLEEITHAVDVLRQAGAEELILLWCTSSYPAPDSAMGLGSIPVLREVSGCLTGLSDHSLGTTAALVGVTLGACMIEKHLTLSRADGGVDSHFSLEPQELQQLVQEVRRAEAMVGQPSFRRPPAEEGSRVFRRSLYVVEDIVKGEPFTPRNLRSIRPGYGLPPKHLDVFLESRASRDIPRGTPLTWDMLCGS